MGILTGCGNGTWNYLNSYAPTHPGSLYNWYYNPALAPVAVDVVALFKMSMNYAVADSSSCGSYSTNASWSYKGTTAAGAGNINGINVIGWYDIESLGVMTYIHDGGVMLEADIRFDTGTAWHATASLPVASGKYDFLSVASHEILHAYGLGHTLNDPDNVMYNFFGAGAGTDRRTKRLGDLYGMHFLN
ncbi:matrixin family metalloprotease [Aestuariimicrobium sp. Y1814]|uniref:matrixin family metalloprotease n=1 Tax=Aestuariimicrobium sp. Y1814 TaxID=3418742 RepID=UPI003DA7A409